MHSSLKKKLNQYRQPSVDHSLNTVSEHVLVLERGRPACHSVLSAIQRFHLPSVSAPNGSCAEAEKDNGRQKTAISKQYKSTKCLNLYCNNIGTLKWSMF